MSPSFAFAESPVGLALKEQRESLSELRAERADTHKPDQKHAGYDAREASATLTLELAVLQ